MAWLLLILGGCFEVGFTTSLRFVEGFRNVPWTIAFLVFGEAVQPFTLAGAGMIVVSCLIAATRRPPPDPDVEAGVRG